MIVVISLFLFNAGSHASDTLHVLMGVSVLVTHMYLPNKRSSLLILHSRIPLIECVSEYSESLYSRIHIRIRHPVFAIRIVFVTWCIRSSPSICANVYIYLIIYYSSTCHERTPSGPGKSVRSLQVAADQR